MGKGKGKKAQATAGAVPAAASSTATYALGKPYNVRPTGQYNNARTWAAIQGALKAGPQTQAQLLAVVKPFNHASFVGYAVRRGWLAVA